jgi:hypothetical protein
MLNFTPTTDNNGEADDDTAVRTVVKRVDTWDVKNGVTYPT